MQKSEFPKMHHYVGFWQIGSHNKNFMTKVHINKVFDSLPQRVCKTILQSFVMDSSCCETVIIISECAMYLYRHRAWTYLHAIKEKSCHPAHLTKKINIC